MRRALASRRLAGLFLGILLLTLLTLSGDFSGSSPASANPATGVLDVSFGSSHVCLVNASGGAECWGHGSHGQLGQPASYRNSPTAVPGLASGVTAIVAGGSHSCALLAAGGVNCWGSNELGQAGRGSSDRSAGPGSVAGIGTAIAVTAGEAHTCAVPLNANLSCWGLNSTNQLGVASSDDCGASGFFVACSLTPITVTSLSGSVAQASAGALHTCAVTTSGGVKCWGSNSFGQLGDGTTVDQLTPVDVTGLTTGVVQVAAGGQHNCALTSVGGVKCWGLNQFGQLGDGSTATSLTPVNVTGLGAGVAAVFVGSDHSCALMSLETMKCWGWNGDGALGDGTTANRVTPADVISISGATLGTAGKLGTCALVAGGSLWCWGSTAFVGDGTWSYRTSPTHIKGLSAGIADVSVGEVHACALTTSGAVKCWGKNFAGQLGNGTSTSREDPVNVLGLSSGVIAISACSGYTCAVTTSGAVKCWGAFPACPEFLPCSATPVDVAGLGASAVDVTAGGSHACALTTAGGVTCWGRNEAGQLGDGQTCGIETCAPVDVTGLTTGVAAVSAGGVHTCAVMISGDVQCWGSNLFGQFGDGTTTESNVPVAGLSSIAVVSAGQLYTCAVTTTSDVKCWGANDAGQLGATSSDLCGFPPNVPCSKTPLTVAGLAGVGADVSAGSQHACAVTTSGGVKCWGSNSSGRLGDGSLADSGAAVDVLRLSAGVAELSVGSSSCAVTVAGRVECWGATLGPDDSVQAVPVQVVIVTVKPIPTQTPCGPAGCPTPTDTPTASPTPLPTDTPIPGNEPAMALAVLDANGSELCRSDGNAKCEILTGSSFTLVVEIVRGPVGGYMLAQSWVDFGPDLTYKRTDTAAEEITWNDCITALALRASFNGTSVLHGCVTGLLPPLPLSSYTGNMVDLSMNCSPVESSTEVQLLPEGDPVARTNGALFAVTFGQNVVPRVGNLTINCVEVVAPAAVGGLALGGELRGIAGREGDAAWLWAALGIGAMVALSALVMVRRSQEGGS